MRRRAGVFIYMRFLGPKHEGAHPYVEMMGEIILEANLEAPLTANTLKRRNPHLKQYRSVQTLLVQPNKQKYENAFSVFTVMRQMI